VPSVITVALRGGLGRSCPPGRSRFEQDPDGGAISRAQ
jgi:hypothetical protein